MERVYFGCHPGPCIWNAIKEDKRKKHYKFGKPSGKYITLFVTRKISLDGLMPGQCMKVKSLGYLSIMLKPIAALTLQRTDNTVYGGDWKDTTEHL